MSDRSTAEFTHAMQEAVAERGSDWRYPTDSDDPTHEWHRVGLPIYVKDDGTPACIIGTALFRLDIQAPLTTAEAIGAYRLLRDLGWEAETAIAASCAQIHQDWGFTWGDCLLVYVEALNSKANDGRDLAATYAAVIERLSAKHGDMTRFTHRRELQA